MSARNAIVLGVAVAIAGSWSAPVASQSDLTLEIGASQIGPPVGIDADNARFLIGGLRGSHYAPGGSGILGSVLFGKTLEGSSGGSFLSAIIEARLAERLSPSLTGSLDVRFMGFGVQDPFPYRAFAAEGGPELHLRTPNLSVKVAGVGGIGRSRLELFRVEGGATRLFEDDLWRAGGTAEFLVGPPTSSFGVVGGVHSTSGGTYSNVGGRVIVAGAWGLAELRIDRWNTPVGVETTGGLSLIVPISAAWSLRGFFGRSDPDPLTLAQPGSGSGGMLLGRSLLSTRNGLDVYSSPYEIIEYGETASRVRMSVELPGSAVTVFLLGDFTFWEPLPMHRVGDRWIAELDVKVGTHHFGFLVDDEWYLPDDAPDVVPDEWGRSNATLVIEGVS